MAMLLSYDLAAGSLKSSFSVKPGKIICARMVFNNSLRTSTSKNKRKLPILLFDVMDTIVRDPFNKDVPDFFRMSMKELVECKHPTAWLEFEKGLINEVELAKKFFKDGRPLDIEGLKNCVRRGYSYLDGVEVLLNVLKKNGYEIHAFTNYSICFWYHMIEDQLKLSNYLSWTFCSCNLGKRKPEPDMYSEVLKRLDVEPASCFFIDDRMKNIDAAVRAGFIGLQFKNVDLLQKDLSLLGIDLSTNVQSDQDLAKCFCSNAYMPS